MTLLPPLSPSVQFQHCCLSFSRAGSTAVYTVPRWSVPALLLSQTTCTGCALRDWYGRLFTVQLLWVTLPLGP